MVISDCVIMETNVKIMGDEAAAVTAAVIFEDQKEEDEDSLQPMTNTKRVSFTTRDNPAQGSTEGGGDHAAHHGEGDHPIDFNNAGVGADTSHHHENDHHHHHHRHAHRSLNDQMPWYTPPIQRQRWGEEQLAPHTDWGDIFFDLFYVASACKCNYM